MWLLRKNRRERFKVRSPGDIEDRIKYQTAAVLFGTTTTARGVAGWRKQWFENRPLSVGHRG